MRVKTHPGLCEGHAVCSRFAPDLYRLDDDGYLDLHLLDVPSEMEAAAVLGAQVCPVHAISILADHRRVISAVTVTGPVP